MKTLPSMMFALGAVLLCAGVAAAQTATSAPAAPGPEAMPMPFDIPYGTPITLDHAKKVVAAAEEEMARHNWKMACAVVEPSGDLVYFIKHDGTQYASIAISQGKARTSATFRRPTRAFQDAINGGQPAILSFPGLVATEGGFPLIENGKLIGAIGCSGATSAQDGIVAKAGADTVK